MTTYFDPTGADKNLLAPDVRKMGTTDLATLAAEAEADVIGHFTRRYRDLRYTVVQPLSIPGTGVAFNPTFVYTPRGYATDLGNGTYVYLAGYTVDASDAAVDAALKLALKREIADVLTWRARQWVRDTAMASTSDTSGTTQSYRPDAGGPFPPSFPSRLKQFDTRPPIWAM